MKYFFHFYRRTIQLFDVQSPVILPLPHKQRILLIHVRISTNCWKENKSHVSFHFKSFHQYSHFLLFRCKKCLILCKLFKILKNKNTEILLNIVTVFRDTVLWNVCRHITYRCHFTMFVLISFDRVNVLYRKHPILFLTDFLPLI